MKAEIHPKYFVATVTCANCKAKFITGATKEDIRVEICSGCHPFYTGKKVLIDTEGRVDKFRQKLAGVRTREKKVRRKKTLEERVNEEISVQLKKEKEVKAKPKKSKGKAEA